MDYAELERAYNSCVLPGEEKPEGVVTSTRVLRAMGKKVEGPGPWLVTKNGIFPIEVED